MNNFRLAASFCSWATKSPSYSSEVITHDQGTWHLVCSEFSTQRYASEGSFSAMQEVSLCGVLSEACFGIIQQGQS